MQSFLLQGLGFRVQGLGFREQCSYHSHAQPTNGEKSEFPPGFAIKDFKFPPSTSVTLGLRSQLPYFRAIFHRLRIQAQASNPCFKGLRNLKPRISGRFNLMRHLEAEMK